MSTKEKVIIANGSGFWGDSNLAPQNLVSGGRIDYLTFDYLAETTMSILAKQRQKDPSAGYAKDFVSVMEEILEPVMTKGIKVIANAGGINPEGAREAILELARQKGYKDIAIAVVTGDNIQDRLEELHPRLPLRNMDTGEDFAPVKDKVMSANVYIGAPAMVNALEQGAQIIITGRTTDTSLTLAPLVYEFGWSWKDWPHLASGIVAGHILECGAQSTGGNFTDWPKVENYGSIGYPLCEMEANGEFVITKHPDSGGLVSVDTISEQLVYEMGNPASYLTPDVTADFTSIQLEQEAHNRVRVTGVQGTMPPKELKVSIAYQEGFKAATQFTMAGFDLERKAERAVSAIWERLGSIGIQLQQTYVEYIGIDSCFGPKGQSPNQDWPTPPEIVVRLGVKDSSRDKIERFALEIAPLLTSGPAGITGFAGGRPRVQPVILYWPTTIPREHVEQIVDFANKQTKIPWPEISYLEQWPLAPEPNLQPELPNKSNPKHRQVPLLLLALARSGDKGDASNVGVIARTPELFPILQKELTPENVKKYFSGIVKGEVVRYDIANLKALNFILHDSLGGGGASSLKNDAQGKTHSQVMLHYPVEIAEDMIPESCWKEKYLNYYE